MSVRGHIAEKLTRMVSAHLAYSSRSPMSGKPGYSPLFIMVLSQNWAFLHIATSFKLPLHLVSVTLQEDDRHEYVHHTRIAHPPT